MNAAKKITVAIPINLASLVHNFVMEWVYLPFPYKMKIRDEVLNGNADTVLELVNTIEERLKEFREFPNNFESEVTQYSFLHASLLALLDEVTT